MAYSDPFLLGPLGAMVPLPSPMHSDGVGLTHQRLGGTAQALRGRTTTDVWATKREWEFPWPRALAQHARTLEMRWRGTSRAPLRLRDPFVTNLLTFDAAVCGAELRAAAATVADTALRWATMTGGTGGIEQVGFDVPAPLVGLVDAVARWTTAAAGSELRADSQDWRRLPVLGQQVTFSGYLRGTGQVAPRLALHAADGAALAVTGSTVTATPTWQRIAVTLPAGTTHLDAYPLLSAVTTTSIQTTGWQVQHGSLTDWEPGGGVPEVVLVDLTDGLRVYGRRELTLTVREV